MRIYKLDEHGREVLHYDAELVQRGTHDVCVRAVFAFEVDLGVVQFARGDIFTEWFYTDRWYNVFRVESGADGTLKGWYCNITRPAHITAEAVRADDLALDVFVDVRGTLHLLDEHEFAALTLSDEERRAAWDAVAQIRARVAQQLAPFEEINPL